MTLEIKQEVTQMNKIKLMSDMINTMKEKESLQGTLKVEGSQDQVQVFSLVNKFEKNMLNGQTKAKIKVELDFQGNHVTQESNREFNQNGCDQEFWRKHQYLRRQKHFCQDDMNCKGIKNKLSRVAFLFKLLNDIQVDQLEDDNHLLSLKISEISDSVQKLIWHKMKSKMRHKRDCYHSFMKEFVTMKPTNIEFTILVNKLQEMEKMLILVDGEQIDESNEKHELNLVAELLFT